MNLKRHFLELEKIKTQEELPQTRKAISCKLETT